MMHRMKGLRCQAVCAALAALLSAFALQGCGGDGSTPESAASQFVESIYAGDTQKAFALLGFDREVPKTDSQLKDLREVKGKLSSASAEMARDTRARGGLKEVSATGRKCDEKLTACEVTVKVTYRKDPKEDTEHVKVAKQGGSWRPVLL